ncbi:hypothetical protein [Chryseobacterium rhizosphaerae]|uniref:Uncharacterized protein n=1 Tax=Chryseobacterium rhizosphaerae TaxID=395937 RepID=A0ABX9IMZ5_9FLAO|nr:hypothetical protein [Chryseobacterium rhizosphaerae]MDR6546234.1 hypothetical protein [Chryseobacterium rhizosphaerae]REC76861.1 hypothetical protein DRF57_05580 [Chryseobacterium rhizosphaerae]GEN66355.1 hypothetical protein CRH01_09230 [Chryseobacterium rhizosphaerae]
MINKTKTIILLAFTWGSFVSAQIGIKTDNLNPSVDLELGSADKALILNRVANTNTVSNPANGMLIYDMSEDCVKVYQADKWSKCIWNNPLNPLHKSPNPGTGSSVVQESILKK